MDYSLKLFDQELLRFSANAASADPDMQILWVTNDTNLLPRDCEPTPEGVYRWIKRRSIPKNRAYVNTLLAKMGLNLNRPLGIIDVCRGLSLNDSYWVTHSDFTGSFEKFNLYDNKFNRGLSWLAFTGYGSDNTRSSLRSYPDLTTNGMLPKCWRRVDKRVYLFKGGTTGASNTGFEPYSEFYAAQVANAMGINAISYDIKKWKNILCSSCEIFTSKETSFLPTGRIVTHGGMSAVEKYYFDLGPQYLEALYDMFLFDAIICNTDRHYGNFGLLLDSRTNEIKAPAPLFDHGNSLFNLAGVDDLRSFDSLTAFANTLFPCVYDDYYDMAAKHLDKRRHEMLRRLLTFHFKRHRRYNLPGKRLKLIEKMIQTRASELLSK